MAKNVEHIQHVKSNVVLEGKPKLPQPGALVEGELAINYADGVETISIKNSSGDIVTFSSDDYYSKQKLGSAFTDANSAVTVTEYIEENELIVSTALNDLKENKLDATAYTPTDLSNYYTKSETSGATELSTVFGTGFTVSSITEVIKEDERVTSEALNDLNTRIGTGFSISSVTVVMDSKADKTEDLDGVKLKKITQSAYDALVQAETVDPNTLYIITD